MHKFSSFFCLLIPESVIDAVGWSDDGALLVTGDRYSARLLLFLFHKIFAVQ